MTQILLSTLAGDLSRSLMILLQGMAGIFVFMGLFYTMIKVLGRVFKEKKEP